MLKDIDVVYKGQTLTLTRFWGNNKLCLWIKNSNQISIPKMEFVSESIFSIVASSSKPKPLAKNLSPSLGPLIISIKGSNENLGEKFAFKQTPVADKTPTR